MLYVKGLELIHRTATDEVPYAICPFQNKVLIGVGKLLRLYDLGRKKLLRKCENKHIPHLVVDIKTVGERIICSDVQESVHWVKYRRGENQLVTFAGIFKFKELKSSIRCCHISPIFSTSFIEREMKLSICSELRPHKSIKIKYKVTLKKIRSYCENTFDQQMILHRGG